MNHLYNIISILSKSKTFEPKIIIDNNKIIFI